MSWKGRAATVVYSRCVGGEPVAYSIQLDDQLDRQDYTGTIVPAFAVFRSSVTTVVAVIPAG